ncbi:DUF3784 domain-containing protein [Paenibacillus sp. CC-CFT747]|nr:DUF3784 domain-containing protein [Paenibacillus sp. CC-CFT747]
MNMDLLFLAVVLIVLAYVVGIKKQTWLLSGYNRKRVRDQDKLAKLAGSYNLIAGLVLLGSAFLDHSVAKGALPSC